MSFTLEDILTEFVDAARIVDQGHVVLVELERRRQRELERDRAWEEEHRRTLRAVIGTRGVEIVKCPRCGLDVERREGMSRLIHPVTSGCIARRKAA